MSNVTESEKLWEPDSDFIENCNLIQFQNWLEEKENDDFKNYEELWLWSVENLETFWARLWDYYEFQSSYETVLADPDMPAPKWFPGARLNYTDHIFRDMPSGTPAIIADSEWRSFRTLRWHELQQKVGSFQSTLKKLGVEKGDRVVGYLPNTSEAVIAFLATAGLGAIWSSCSPDFGPGSVVDRFSQIEPKVLVTCDGYYYSGESYDRTDVVDQINETLDSLVNNILVDVTSTHTPERYLTDSISWEEAVSPDGELTITSVPFDHPLYVLFSSGTTGPPKPIVHGHGGILLEHHKAIDIHHNLTKGDRFFWSTTTGWMMWNYLVSGLLRGSTIQLYDGDVSYPDYGRLWSFAETTDMNVFGTGAPYLHQGMKQGFKPQEEYDLESLDSIGSTGAPLSPEGFQWIYESINEDLWVTSVSGGTDVCTAFLAGVPTKPVRAGELQGRTLGSAVFAYDDDGNRIVGQTGELVIEKPLPSMPIYFWNDQDNLRYRESYFDQFPGVWRHGDWVKITENGGAIIYGRSDSTLNRKGIRFGSSEIYRALEPMEKVEDSLVIGVNQKEGSSEPSEIVLFVVPEENVNFNQNLIQSIQQRIRDTLTPRHVPDEIVEAPGIPRTLSGKKMEIPVTKLFEGQTLEKAANKDSMSNPDIMDWYVNFVRESRYGP